METICLKLDETMLKNIDNNLASHNFSTRTEFIREAVREKLSGFERERLIQKFLSFRGKSKVKTTDEENRKTREIVFDEYCKERGWIK